MELHQQARSFSATRTLITSAMPEITHLKRKSKWVTISIALLGFVFGQSLGGADLIFRGGPGTGHGKHVVLVWPEYRNSMK
jgi:hypothetical protein